MKIKTRLAFQFTIIVAGILLFFSILVYYFSYNSQLMKFRQNLLDTAKNTATLLINVAEVDSALLKKIQQSTISWEGEELVITDQNYNLRYSNNINFLSKNSLLISSSKNDLNYFSYEARDGVFYKHEYNELTYFVYVLAFDRSRRQNLSDLRKILFWSNLFSVWFSVLLSYIFSGRAIKPISHIIKNVKEINSLKLGNRLDEGNRTDELAQLAITFNEMLTNLEIAFRSQEDFVSHASHELRTPLTVMIGGSDYFLSRERAKEEYIEHISGLVNDLKKLNVLLNSLLELAQINRDKSIIYSDVRIDEIVLSEIQVVRKSYPGRKIVPRIQYPESGNELLIRGNTGMLEIAFKNLLDNACKFSNEDVGVEFVITQKSINIIINDRGIGIPAQEINKINKPFTRASNAKYIGGFGIGLALVFKILELHEAEIKINSRENEGSRFEVGFKRLN